MRWTFLGLSVGGFVSLWSVGPAYVLFPAFIVMCANFASFCLLYDRPQERARLRISERLRAMNPNTDMAQRLSTAPISVSAIDRRLGFGAMTLLNMLTGIAGAILLAWGIVLRVF